MPEVTAVITCMTDAERPYLRAAVESVLAQSVQTDVVLCVTDTNSWVHDELADELARVRLLPMPLMPPGDVRNAGVDAARTELVAFLDGDDVWVSRKIERQVAMLREHDLDVIGSKHVLIRSDDKPFFFAFARQLPMTSSWLGRRSTFREHRFNSQLIAEDAELWLRLARSARLGVAEAYLLRYRIRPGSASKGTASRERKGAYERRSHRPGGRAALLAVSRMANIALRARHALSRRRAADELLRVS